MEYQVIDTSYLTELRKAIDKSDKKKKIAVIAKNDEFNRKVFENNKVDLVFELESGRKDRLKQRDSGLNHVLCKLAKKNDIVVGIDFSKLEKMSDFELSSYLAKVEQNIMLCKKYKVKMVVVNSSDGKNLGDFLLTLGMSTSMAKWAVENAVVL